jgi:hypothetical protein
MACAILAGVMVALSYGWRARFYRNPWDYRFTGLVFALLSAFGVFVGLHESRRQSEPRPTAQSSTPADPRPNDPRP